MTNGGTGGYQRGTQTQPNATLVTEMRQSHRRQDLHPYRNHSNKKGERGESGSFLDDGAKHVVLHERKENIVLSLFLVKWFHGVVVNSQIDAANAA